MGSVSSCQKQEAQQELERELADKLHNDKLQKEVEEQKVKELAFEARGIDLKQAVPTLEGQAIATGLVDVKEEKESEMPDDFSEVSVDSDIITDDQKPLPIPACCPGVVEDQLEGILEFETNKLQEEVFESLKIERSECKELQEGGIMEQVCEQFMCVICDNLSVPTYTIGKDGVKPESVRVPECENCERMACYVCWRKHILHGDRKCPNCQDQIKISDRELEILRNQAKKLPDYSDDGAESILDIDDYMKFCTKRPMKNILFQLRIIHRCPDQEGWAIKKAEELWDKHFNELMETSGRKKALQKKISAITGDINNSTMHVNEGSLERDESMIQMEGGEDSIDANSDKAASEMPAQKRSESPIVYKGDAITNQTQSQLNYGKLDSYPDRRSVATPQTMPANANGNLQAPGAFEVFEEDQFNYEFDDKSMSRSPSQKIGSVLPSEKNDAKELSQLHAESADKKSVVPPKTELQKSIAASSIKNAGDVIMDSEAPSEYQTVIPYEEAEEKSVSVSKVEDSMFNKTGPVVESQISESPSEKRQKVQKMKTAVNQFLKDMVTNEQQYQRFKKMEEDDQDEMEELVNRQINMFETQKTRQAKRTMIPQSRATLTTQVETQASQTVKGDKDDIDLLEKELDDVLTEKPQDIHMVDLEVDSKEEEQILIDEVEFEQQKKIMIRKIADTLYKTVYSYLEYLSHMMTECGESTKVKGGCALPKCCFKDTVSVNALRLHLVNDCNKIMMQCNVCDEQFKRPWVPYHNCIRVYRARIIDKNNEIADQDEVIGQKNQIIEGLNLDKDHEYERQLQHERVRQTLQMRIAGPEASSQANSKMQSRKPGKSEYFKTGMVNDQKLARDSEFPDFVNSMNQEDSTYDQQEMNFETNSRDVRMMMAKGTINSFAKDKFGAETQHKFQDINRVTSQSIGVGPSMMDKQSIAIGRSSHYTQRSNAAGPTEYSRHSIAAGESRMMYDMASQGAGRSESGYNQSVGVGMTEGRMVDQSIGARTGLEFKSQGDQYTKHEQSQGIQMTTPSKHSVAMGISRHERDFGVQMTEGSQHSIGINPITVQGKSGGNQMSVGPSYHSKGIGATAARQQSQAQQMSAMPSQYSRGFGPSEDNRMSGGNQMSARVGVSKGVGSGVDQASGGNQMTNKSMHSQAIGQSQAHMVDDGQQMSPRHGVSKGVGSGVDQASQGNQMTVAFMNSNGNQMSPRHGVSKGVGSGVDQTSGGNQMTYLQLNSNGNQMSPRNGVSKGVGSGIEQRSQGNQMTDLNFEIQASPNKQGAISLKESPRSQGGSRLSKNGLQILRHDSDKLGSPSKLSSLNSQMGGKSLGTNFRASALQRSNTLQYRPVSGEQPNRDWDNIAPPTRNMTVEDTDKLKSNIVTIKAVEIEIGKSDPYVEHIIGKYKGFNFNMKLFMQDDQIADAQMEENFPVKEGQFKANVFWGQHLAGEAKFTPHGFCLFLDRKNKILHVGSFKNGKEYGQQRVIQSYPANSRYFSQFTSVQGALHGPALIERQDGRVEVGNYVKNKQDGVWRYRYVDGRVETEMFAKGKITHKPPSQQSSQARRLSQMSATKKSLNSHAVAGNDMTGVGAASQQARSIAV